MSSLAQQELSSLSSYTRHILHIGDWQSIPIHHDEATVADVRIYRCREVAELPTIARQVQPGWLLIGLGLDDYDVQETITDVRAAVPEIRLALLGLDHDWRRCERWLRRGCDAYLNSSASLDQVVSALYLEHSIEATVVHKSFHRLFRLLPTPKLTRREDEVLHQLVDGKTNREIAATLHVTENTVEFHMRRLLSKLSARSRLEVVERARSLGLV